jgi:hypothetical protein
LYAALVPALAPVPVLDRAGPNQIYPYSTIGEMIATEDDLLAEQAVNIEVTVHLWSRQPGMQEVQQLMQTAKDALDRAKLPVSGFQWVDCVWTWGQTLRDPDGVTRHGILRFNVLTFESIVETAPPPPEPEGLTGTVDCNGSMSVTWASGDKFTPEVIGETITIAGADYSIFQYVTENQIFVDPPPPAASGVAYTILL